MLRPTILVLALFFAWPVIQAAPKPVPLPVQSVQHVEHLMAARQLDDATQAIRTLIKKDPGNARMHYYLAQVHAANGNWADAGAMLKKAKYFDWKLQFASSKARVAEFEQLIEARKKDPYPGVHGTPQHDEWKRSEKRSYDVVAEVVVPIETEMPLFLMTMKAPEKAVVVETPRQRTFLWIFASALGLISAVMIFMVRRFNAQNTLRNTRLAEAAIKEQKIVLYDLMRVLNDVEAITKSENLGNLHTQSTILLDRVHTLMTKLEENELQNIGDIEQYVRQTQLYRTHCYNYQDLPAAALT